MLSSMQVINMLILPSQIIYSQIYQNYQHLNKHYILNMWFFIALILLKENACEQFSEGKLHEIMTKNELEYYFQTSDVDLVPPYEIVDLPTLPISLKLKKNEEIVSPALKIFVHDDDGIDMLSMPTKNCNYLYQGDLMTAALSICSPKNVDGLIFSDNSSFEIKPLTERLRTILGIQEALGNSVAPKNPHLLKKASFTSNFLYDHVYPSGRRMWSDSQETLEDIFGKNGQNRKHNEHTLESQALTSRSDRKMTLELAMFFDEAAYKIFAPHLDYDTNRLRDMLLDIMKAQPKDLPHHDGERGKLLDSFCAYQENLNPESDRDPDHWDMALYISGLDFYAYEKGRKSGVTMGLAPVGGVCSNTYACVIAEFGTTNAFGKPYPSAGLGMHHDSSGNYCAKEGYIMSPSRGTNGETQWSTCSAEVVADLKWAKCLQDTAKLKKLMDHSTFRNNPGQMYTAKKQCEILLRDKDAVVLPHQELSTICYNLQCKTPNRSGFYFAGPALEGTECGNGRYCEGGECVKKTLPKPISSKPGGWGPWKQGECLSGCLEKSVGYSIKRRFCNNPKPLNSDEGCLGSNVERALCSDQKICKTKKISAVDYASHKCREFAQLLEELDPDGGGLQAPHEEGRLWMGCAIFCKNKEFGTFYTPRMELNDLGISSYFPDGTWCHRENNINYYCMLRHCLPENFQFTKASGIEDVPILQNAMPHQDIPQNVKDYFTLFTSGKPFKTVLDDMQIGMKEEEWETDDYVEVPELQRQRLE
ncbi:unnamed protein product [Callosobruchus maculatus]|uniref:Peptidase M12B domain-containing protein n=1 Tax=Callosobruchus maculatus TaxID=64391 RepID=A0A653BEW9_CALMS|nr:unnamed protein product [Callosobruchus maculatus]